MRNSNQIGQMKSADINYQMVNLAKFDQAKYNDHFRENVDSIKAGPLENQYRSCNDICCVITFIVMVLAMLVIGAIMINDGKDFYSNFEPISSGGVSFLASTFKMHGGIIVGMFAFALFLSIIYLVLLKNFPKCMIYTMIILIYIILIALIIVGAVNRQWWMVIVFGILTLILTCILYCFRDRIKVGILLLKVSAQFLTQKPSVYVAPLYPLFFSIIFFIWWVIALLAVVYTIGQKEDAAEEEGNEADTSKETAFLVLWVIFAVFMGEFLYYVQTFLIGTACAQWYYGIQQNYCTNGVFRVNRYHIGSLTFGALIVTIVNMLKRAASNEAGDQMGEGNVVAGICLCLVACCLSCIEDLLQVLNHNAVIVMTVTGQSYVNSAKSAISIIFQNLGLFWIVDFFSDLVVFFGILLCVGLPTILGIILVRYTADDKNVNEAGYAAVIIFFLSLIIAVVIISMIGEAMSCVFIFYCFDRKFISSGIYVSNSPAAIRDFGKEAGDAVDAIGSGQNLHTRQ